MTRWPLRLAWFGVCVAAVVTVVVGARARAFDAPPEPASATASLRSCVLPHAQCGAVDAAPWERNALRADAAASSAQPCLPRGGLLDTDGVGAAIAWGPLALELLLDESRGAASAAAPLLPARNCHACPAQARAPPWLG